MLITELCIGSPGSRLSMDEIVSKACDEVHTYLTHKLVSLTVELTGYPVLAYIAYTSLSYHAFYSVYSQKL